MKKEKSAKAPVKKAKKVYDISTGKATTLKKKSTGEKVTLKRKEKPNFSTEKFVDIENGTPLRKPEATLSIEVFRVAEDTCEITVRGTGERKFMVEALTKAMIQSDGYFDLFMEAAAMAMITKAESAAKKTKTTSASTKKKVTKKAATKKK